MISFSYLYIKRCIRVVHLFLFCIAFAFMFKFNHVIMKPKKFKESTKVLQRPSTMSDDECSELPVFCDGKQCISCWRPSIKERFLILIFGRVWLGVLSGKTQPPVYLSGERVFIKSPFKVRLLTFVSDIKRKVTNLFKCHGNKNG